MNDNGLIERKRPKKDTELDPHEVIRICDEWTEDPELMLKWRTKEFKMLVLLLRHKAWNPTGSPRSKDALQLKAVDMFTKLLIAMESIRGEVPTVCPKCGHKFQTG